MDESPQVPQDIDIEKLTFDLDQDFNHLYPQIKQLLTLFKSLHPHHKNDVGTFPSYQAVLTPAPGARFGVIEESESQFPCNALLTMKAVPFMVGSNTKADKYISKTTHAQQDLSERKWHYTVDHRSHNSQLVPAPKIHLPKNSDILHILHGKAVCQLDVANAFHSIVYAPSSRQFTSFWGVSGQKYQFRRCCQGMHHFTTQVAQIFNVTSFKKFCEEHNYTFDPVQDICSEWFILYVDDILIAITPETFIKRLHYELQTLFTYKLKINFTKLLLGTYSFAFLGSQYNLKESFSSIKLDRREALLAYREPHSFAEALSRAASLDYNSRFLPGLQKFLIPSCIW